MRFYPIDYDLIQGDVVNLGCQAFLPEQLATQNGDAWFQNLPNADQPIMAQNRKALSFFLLTLEQMQFAVRNFDSPKITPEKRQKVAKMTNAEYALSRFVFNIVGVDSMYAEDTEIDDIHHIFMDRDKNLPVGAHAVILRNAFMEEHVEGEVASGWYRSDPREIYLHLTTPAMPSANLVNMLAKGFDGDHLKVVDYLDAQNSVTARMYASRRHYELDATVAS